MEGEIIVGCLSWEVPRKVLGLYRTLIQVEFRYIKKEAEGICWEKRMIWRRMNFVHKSASHLNWFIDGNGKRRHYLKNEVKFYEPVKG